MALLTVDWLLPSLRAAAENEPSVAASAKAVRASGEWRMAQLSSQSIYF
jgi:predicted exporter